MAEYQHELFEELDKKKKRKRTFKNHLFDKDNVRFTLSYEQVGLFIILFVVLLSVIFTLGVERGKKLNNPIVNEKKFKQEVKKVTKDKKVTAVKQKKKTSKKDNKGKELEETEDKKLGKYFSVQVVTYKKNSLVNQEIGTLEKKGYAPFVVNTGKYKHIYIGKFKSRKEAEKILGKLRKRYSDCFIKEIGLHKIRKALQQP